MNFTQLHDCLFRSIGRGFHTMAEAGGGKPVIATGWVT
jgi:hypothetical protein